MRILSFKPGHDGAVALVEDGELRFSYESEKDSFPRYGEVTPAAVAEAMANTDGIPDVICISGWAKGFHSTDRQLGAGYFGWSEEKTRTGKSRIFGREVTTFTSTHERSHLMSAFGMSPFAPDQPAYGLVWEGNIGSLYLYRPGGEVELLRSVMLDPGNKYQYVFALADPTTTDENGGFRYSNAGKMMALTAFSDALEDTPEQRKLIDSVLARGKILKEAAKSDFLDSPFYNVGVESQEFKNLAWRHSERIFHSFLDSAREVFVEGYPLLVSGGCGLNCDWNAKWRDSGLFRDVFVPPVPNDSGSAIGTAIDAQRHLSGESKISWNVYSGQDFVVDCPEESAEFEFVSDDPAVIARALADGAVLAWAQGKAEIGPRALGNRSLLASPQTPGIQERLNWIKGREGYRPVAPMCRLEDVSRYFEWSGPSPFMLFFQRVREPELIPGVTHVDASARVQTVTAEENPRIHALLTAVDRASGVGVLCNTSLNFNGKGFINRLSDVREYALARELDGYVHEGRYYRNRSN
ncbi:carbamoyltransferase C-terminal domain-containing protein [Streptomyces sp. NPDC002838]|uniref:carbamoyltransferase C-terminal domain-containing protein n=1 Tax=Streptomyces sp. NPDC002838 TaxID=3154436 RepID=UPI00332EF7F6